LLGRTLTCIFSFRNCSTKKIKLAGFSKFSISMIGPCPRQMRKRRGPVVRRYGILRGVVRHKSAFVRVEVGRVNLFPAS